MGAFSRNKGARGERELCKLLSDNLGGKFTRNLKQYQQAQHGDIEQRVGPYLIEVKNCKDLAIPTWWNQAVAAATKVNAEPCLVYKVVRKGWRFIVPHPAASGEWRLDLDYTIELREPGFFLHVRELGG